MLSVQNVSKAYGPKKLFEDVNVTFSEGRRYGLTGPNGAGKTTFMKILAGDEEADSGDVFRPKRLGILRRSTWATPCASSPYLNVTLLPMVIARGML